MRNEDSLRVVIAYVPDFKELLPLRMRLAQFGVVRYSSKDEFNAFMSGWAADACNKELDSWNVYEAIFHEQWEDEDTAKCVKFWLDKFEDLKSLIRIYVKPNPSFEVTFDKHRIWMKLGKKRGLYTPDYKFRNEYGFTPEKADKEWYDSEWRPARKRISKLRAFAK